MKQYVKTINEETTEYTDRLKQSDIDRSLYEILISIINNEPIRYKNNMYSFMINFINRDDAKRYIEFGNPSDFEDSLERIRDEIKVTVAQFLVSEIDRFDIQKSDKYNNR